MIAKLFTLIVFMVSAAIGIRTAVRWADTAKTKPERIAWTLASIALTVFAVWFTWLQLFVIAFKRGDLFPPEP